MDQVVYQAMRGAMSWMIINDHCQYSRTTTVNHPVAHAV